MTAKPVANFLDPFLRDTLASLLVWPNRCESVCVTLCDRSNVIAVCMRQGFQDRDAGRL